MKGRFQSRHLTSASLIAAGMWAAAASTAFAQDGPSAAQDVPAESAGSPDIQDIVVTAQKRAQNLSDVPMSVNAISGEALAARGVQNVQDLAKFTPGLSLSLIHI